MAGINDYMVNVILQAKAEGLAAFAEMSAGMKLLTDESGRTNQQLESLRDHARNSSLQLQGMGLSLNDISDRARHAEGELHRHTEQLELVGINTRETAQESAHMADILEEKLTPALRHTGDASGNSHSMLYRFIQGMIPGQVTAGNITIALTGLAAAFAPLSLAIIGVTAVMGAWLVGMASFLAITTFAVGGLALLAGGVAALGIAQMGGLDPAKQQEKAQKALTTAAEQHENALQALARAQLAYDNNPTAANLLRLQQAHEHVADAAQKQTDAENALNVATTQTDAPMGRLRQHLEDMAKALGEKAVPLTAQMLVWADALLPSIQKLGEAILAWFGPRLPEILRLATDAANGFFSILDLLGSTWATITQDVLDHPLDYERVLGGFVKDAMQAIVGLLQNLFRLSEWFIVRAPGMATVIGPVLDGIGRLVQWLGLQFGNFVDWVIEHWPEITAAIQGMFRAIMDGWNALAPTIAGFKQSFQDLQPFFQYIRDHAENLRPVLELLGLAIGVVILALEALGVIIVLAVAALVKLAGYIEWIITEFVKMGQEVGGAIGGMFAAIGSFINFFVVVAQNMAHEWDVQTTALRTAAQHMMTDFGAFFSAIGGFFHVFVIAAQNIAREWDAQTRALMTAAHTMWNDFGNVFAQIGNIFAFFTRVGQNIVQQWNAQTAALRGAANQMQSDFGRVFGAVVSMAQGMVNGVGGAFAGLSGKVHDGLMGVKRVLDSFGGGVNRILGGFGVTIDPLPFATGGVVPGYAPGQDSVLAMLSPGEGILRPEVVRSMGGPAAIDDLNRDRGAGPFGLATSIGAFGGQCIAEGTQVATADGPRPIESVREGNLVWTRQGLKPVTWSALTRRRAEVLRIEAGGQELVCTPDHRLWAQRLSPRLEATDAVGVALPTVSATSIGTGLTNSEVVALPSMAVTAEVAAVETDRFSRFQDFQTSLPSATSKPRQKKRDKEANLIGISGIPAPLAFVPFLPGGSFVDSSAIDDRGKSADHILIDHRELYSGLSNFLINPKAAFAFEEAGSPSDLGRSCFESSQLGMVSWHREIHAPGDEGRDVSASPSQLLNTTNCISQPAWCEAGDLKPGDRLWRFDEQALEFVPLTIEQVSQAAAIDTYDITVADAHEFVASGFLVHNCVEFIQRVLGLTYHGNANTWTAAPYAHTQTAATGEIAVFTGGQYGHVAIVTNPLDGYNFDVIDSNWVAPLTIGAHRMNKGMYGFATFLNPGITLSGLAALAAGIPGITIPVDQLNGLVDRSLGGLGGWPGTLAKGLMNAALGGIKHSLGFDEGGLLPPGMSTVWNGTGRPEIVTPAASMDRVEQLLDSIDRRLAALAGQPRVNAASAAVRY